jgi:hypothetical protein
MKTLTALLVLLAGLSSAGDTFALDKAYLTLLNSDLGKLRRTLITANLKLDQQEGTAFWPLYDDYQGELNRLGQARLELLQEYKAVGTNISDEMAGAMLLQFLDMEEKETGIKRKFYQEVEKKVSPRVAARLFQVDNQINLMLNLELAASKIPIAR